MVYISDFNHKPYHSWISVMWEEQNLQVIGYIWKDWVQRLTIFQVLKTKRIIHLQKQMALFVILAVADLEITNMYMGEQA